MTSVIVFLPILIAMAGPGTAEDARDDIAGFPNLVSQIRTHWIQGNTLFYVKGGSIVLRDLNSGSESHIPFGDYEVKELIVHENEIALSAKRKETVWSAIMSGISFSYDEENDTYSGVVCRIDAKQCSVEVSGNYLIRGFQPYAEGYIFTKTEWKDYSFGADTPTDIYSSVLKVAKGTTTVVVERLGGVQSMYVHELNGSIYLDIRNGSEATFEPGVGVFELVGGLVKQVSLFGIDERYKNLYGGQLRTNGRSWAISFRRVVNGKGLGIYSKTFCSGKKQRIDAVSSVFVDGDEFFYVDLEGFLQKRSC